MLLVQFTINGTVNYLSIEGHSLTHYWQNKIIAFDPPQMLMPYIYGGYCKVAFGSISFAPDLFDVDDWVPPSNGAITIQYTATTEGAAETLFTGIAHIESINREEVRYGLYSSAYDEVVADATAYNDTLDNVLDGILTGIAEINTLNVASARAISPNVQHTTSGEQLSIELASEIAAFYTHLFYIVGDTAYLVDMLGYKNEAVIDEYDFYPASYPYQVPTSIARSGDFNQNSAYTYGNELSVTQYHDLQANVETCLADILTIVNRPRAILSVPFLGGLPNPGKKLSWVDESQNVAVDFECYVRGLRYDFANDTIEIEGDGVLDIRRSLLLLETGDYITTEVPDYLIVEEG